MNIGIYLGNFTPDQGGSYTLQGSLLDALETVDHNHKIFVFSTGNIDRIASSRQVVYVSVASLFGRIVQLIRTKFHVLNGRKTETAILLQKAVSRYSIDIIWFVTNSFELVDIPYICTVLDLEHRVHPFFPEVSVTGCVWEERERSFSTMIPRAAYVICGTEAGKQQVIDYYHPDPDRVRVIPFPVASFAEEQKECISDSLVKQINNEPYLFYPAQFWPHKNHIVLMNALKILRDKYRFNIKLVFCGSDKGNLSYIKNAAQELGVDSNVHFLGFVSSEDLYLLYKSAFALVFPSIFGPDNLPPLEAFAIGCPVIAANVAGASEQLGDAALLINPLIEEEIACAVIRLHEEPDLRRLLVEKGKLRAKMNTSHNYLLKIVAIFEEFKRYRRCWSGKEKYIHS